MRETTGRLLRAADWDRANGFAVISEAVWSVTMVDATLIRYRPGIYSSVLARQPAAQRRITEDTFAPPALRPLSRARRLAAGDSPAALKGCLRVIARHDHHNSLLAEAGPRPRRARASGFAGTGGVARVAALKLLYVGTLPPHQGGSAIVAAQILPGLSEAGSRGGGGRPAAGGRRRIRRGRRPGALLPDALPRHLARQPAADDYRRRERESIRSSSGRRSAPPAGPLIVGRESFAPHVAGLAPGVPKACSSKARRRWGS